MLKPRPVEAARSRQNHRLGIHAESLGRESFSLLAPFTGRCLCVAGVGKGGIQACALKTTRTLKSDTISRVIYLQLNAPPLLEEQRTDVSLALMKKTTNRRWGSIVWGEASMMIEHTEERARLVCVCGNINFKYRQHLYNANQIRLSFLY